MNLWSGAHFFHPINNFLKNPYFRQKVNIHYLEWSFFDGMSCVSATLSHSRQDTSKGMVKVPKAIDKGLRYKADTIDNVGHG